MDDAEFSEELKQIVARRAAAANLVDTLAFVKEVSERLEEDPVFGEFVDVEYQGTGTRNRALKLHGYTRLDEADGNLGLVIGRWNDSKDAETLSTSAVSQLSGWVENFVRESVDAALNEKIYESNEAYVLASFLREEKQKISRIRIHIFTNQVLSQRYREENIGQVGGIPIERHIWDLKRLKAVYESSREREAVEIEMSDFGVEGIPYLEAAGTKSLQSYLCVIKGAVLADMFERYGSRLLEGNVRSFLGMKGAVNKGIRATIQDSPQLFFAYNNGIAATASEVLLGESSGRGVITRLVDLQIVNGGQTTAAVLSARKKEGLSLEGVTVQMKLTKVAASESHDLIPKIAEYANTQNKVAVADFFANHPFHRKIEEISRRLTTPAKAGQRIQSKWFYERSRGQYQNERLYLSKAKKDMFDSEYPSRQLINKTELAKYDSAWNCKPHWASLGAQKNFAKFASQFSSRSAEVSETDYWETLSPNFGDVYYQKIVAVALLWKAAEDIVHEGRGTWYLGDYRPQIVAYSLARIFHDARDIGSEVDLGAIWTKQEVSSDIRRFLTIVAERIQGVLLTPPIGSTNVGEWSKKEPCWEKVKECEIPSIDTISSFLLSKQEFGKEKLSAKKQGAQDDGISVQKAVLAMTESGYWKALLTWPQTGRLLSPPEVTLVQRASTINGFMKINLEKDWRKLLQLSKLAESEGFRHLAR